MAFRILDDVRMSPAPNGTNGVLTRDLARLHKMLDRHPDQPSIADTSLVNSGRATHPGIMYFTLGSFGDSPTLYTLLVDGEYDKLWIGKGYSPSSVSSIKGKPVDMKYGDATFTGTECTEKVTFGTYVVKEQLIVAASDVQGFDLADGVIGFDRHEFTSKTADNYTLFENMLSLDGLVTITYFPPTDPRNIGQAELHLGEPEPSSFVEPLTYVQVMKPADVPYSNTDQMCIKQSLHYGDTTIMEASVGVLEFMNTLILLATEHFEAYQKATGATRDEKTGLLTVTAQQFKDMKSLFFEIGSATYELTPDSQIWPPTSNSSLGGEADLIYLVIADSGTNNGSGYDIICGYSFMRHFYTVYDAKNHQIGLATTKFTNAVLI